MVKTILLKTDQTLGKITEIFLIILGFPFFGMLMVEVVSRKLFNYSLFGVYEFAGYLSIWFAMVGAFQGYRNKELARLTFVVDKLSPTWRNRVFVINQLLILLALFLLSVSGLLFTFNPAVITQSSVSFEVPVFYFYLGIPVGLILMAFQTLIHLFFEDGNSLIEETEGLE